MSGRRGLGPERERLQNGGSRLRASLLSARGLWGNAKGVGEWSVDSRMTTAPSPPPAVTSARILRLWWPLAASWLLMGAELLLFTVFVARMPDPEVNLAAYGSIVFPISLVIEAPIIMFLAMSTALVADGDAYAKLHRMMLKAGVLLTVVHVLVAFTPLYDLVAGRVLKVPVEVMEPARIGLRIMTPWTFAIAYRRFHQGILIRFEESRAVVVGTAVRLVANVAVLSVGFAVGGIAGIVVGTCAVATAVVVEAVYVGWRVQPVLRERVRPAPVHGAPLTRSAFLSFYVPLAMTPLMMLVIQPIGAGAMSRMPNALASLAAWPAVHGFVFILRSVGIAFNEVVVTLIGEPGAVRALRRFCFAATAVVTGLILLVAFTPLSAFWFGTVSGLAPELASVACTALLFAVLMPGYTFLQSWYQGALVHSRRTRAVTEAVAIYGVVAVSLLTLGARWQAHTGIYFAITTFTIGGILQTAWLWWRSRGPMRALGPDSDSVPAAEVAWNGTSPAE